MQTRRFTRLALAVTMAVGISAVGAISAAGTDSPSPPETGRSQRAQLLPPHALGAFSEPATGQYRSQLIATGTDAAGDATRPLGGAAEDCGDIRTFSATYTPGLLSFSASLNSPCDPNTDTRWTAGATQLDWLVDVDFDQFIDYVVQYVSDGALNARVLRVSDGAVVCTATPRYDLLSYNASFDPGCIGNPRAVRYATEMTFDADPTHDPSSDVITDDVAPDNNLYAGTVTRRGYWTFGQDGHVYHFGADSSDLEGLSGPLNLPVVGAALTPTGRGYWEVASDGGIFAFGDATFHGSTGAIELNRPIVGMASTPTGNGYWLVASDGGIFAFGDATFHGSTGAIRLNRPIVGMASTPTGNGYWLVASDGGIFAFGDATFHGSTGAIELNQPIVGMAPSRSGKGYWFVASDGGIFAFGDAAFYGSAGSLHLAEPIVGMASSPTGKGYWFVASDGGIFTYGDADFDGVPGLLALFAKPMVALAAL